MGLNQFRYVTGLQYTSPTNACVIGTSTPIVALLLSALFLHMRITARRAVGIVLACCGALVLLLGSVHGGGGHLLGDALCLCSQSQLSQPRSVCPLSGVGNLSGAIPAVLRAAARSSSVS